MKKTFLIAALVVGLITGCSPKKEIAQSAQDISNAAKEVKSSVSHAKQGVSEITKNTTAAAVGVERANTLVEDVEASNELDKVEALLAAVPGLADSVNKNLDAIDSRASAVATEADSVAENVKDVEDKAGFFDKLGDVLKWIGYFAVAALVVVIGWRFGLDKLVKSVATFVSGIITSLSNRLNEKWNGPAKLANEVIAGQTSPKELIAALRSHFPKFNQAVKEDKKAE